MTAAPRPMTSRRLVYAELLTAVSGAALFVAMFALDWFSLVDPAQRRAAEKLGVIGASGPSLHSDGWSALPAPRWLLLATCVLCAASVATALRATPRIAARVNLVLLVVALTSAALIVLRVIDPPGPNEFATVEVGAYVGLAMAVGAAAGAYLTIRGLGSSLAGIRADLEGNARAPERTARDEPPPPVAPDPRAPDSVPPPSTRPGRPGEPG
jgi:hypothetical protein